MSTENETKETVAKVGFGLFMAMVLGPVGIVIAALAVGTERAWNRRNGGRPLAGSNAGRSGGAGWRERVARHEDWLAGDWEQRRRYRDAHRTWWRNGADPSRRPKPPKGGFRKWVRRTWARGVIFAGGARDGGAAAAKARREGANLRAIATARPVADIPEKAAEPTTQQPTPTAAAPPPGNNAPYVADDPTVTYEPPDVVDVPVPVPADPADTQPAPPSNSQQEEPVTALTATAPVAQQPQGETNLDLTVVDLTEVETLLALVDDGVDQVAQTGQRLDTAISRATERAVLAGAPAATMAALDAASGVSRQLGDHLSGVSQASTEAGDQVTAARHSLTPAQDAQDRLHSAGARGEFVSTATSD